MYSSREALKPTVKLTREVMRNIYSTDGERTTKQQNLSSKTQFRNAEECESLVAKDVVEYSSREVQRKQQSVV